MLSQPRPRKIKRRYVDTLQIWPRFRYFRAHSFGPLFYVTSSQLRSGSARAPPVRSAALSAMPSGPTREHRYPPMVKAAIFGCPGRHHQTIIHAKPVSQVLARPAIDNHVAIWKMRNRHERNNAIATSIVTGGEMKVAQASHLCR
ncbi:hypothetical protein FVEG_15101 [Fusarium verticillioides 7600]|uniref:Uncharacterized protein n=1 Tax=Gibberella moniliformis (strain M3125 / FGSC 7600) TaxID=334819 RepID=W7LX78_GIBM7|nr:hypothetical protein FVEG_15101 [Fusarium verticillioides 7600]EWG40004.1 hypothetical protein FVEG_15101 [Fusarium verticillioides 7600]